MKNCYCFGYSYNLAGRCWWDWEIKLGLAQLLLSCLSILCTHICLHSLRYALWLQVSCQSQFGNQSKRAVPVHVEFYCVWFWSTVTHSRIHLRSVSPSMPGAKGSLLISRINKHTTYLNEVSTHPLF